MTATSEQFREHIEQLERLAISGDELAIRSLSCMALLVNGWRYGDPDPTDPAPDGGGEIITLDDFRRAA